MSVPELLKSFRKKHGLSQREPGYLLGVDQVTISYWERGKLPAKFTRPHTRPILENIEAKLSSLTQEEIEEVKKRKRGGI